MENRVLLSLPSELDVVRCELSEALRGVREELDEHLDTINRSTDEVQSNFEYLFRLDDKIDNVAERVEQMILAIKSFGIHVNDSPMPSIQLEEKEKSVFLVMYTAEKSVSYNEISKAIRESEFMVRSFVASMVQKGIPIRKSYVGQIAVLRLDNRFREMQAKSNILGISQKTVKEFC